MPEKPNPYKRQEQYAKRKGIVKRGYSLRKKTADRFSEACKANGKKVGPELEMLMKFYVKQPNELTTLINRYVANPQEFESEGDK